MLQMNRLTDQAFVVLVYFVRAGHGATVTARSVGEDLDLPGPTAAKVLKLLTRAGLLVSTRGLCGGYQLGCDAARTTVRQVIEAVEGPLAITECSLTAHITCDTHSTCGLGHAWPLINTVIVSALERVTLADLAAPAEHRRTAAEEHPRLAAPPAMEPACP